MNTPFVHEFLYRGRPENGPGSGAPGWHVVIGQYIESLGRSEMELRQSEPLTPEQAAAAGFSLPAILKAINAAALADRDAQAAALVAMTAERDKLAAQIAEMALGAES